MGRQGLKVVFGRINTFSCVDAVLSRSSSPVLDKVMVEVPGAAEGIQWRIHTRTAITGASYKSSLE